MQMNTTQSQDRERFVQLGSHDVQYQGQVLYIEPTEQLKPYPQKLTDRLIHFAKKSLIIFLLQNVTLRVNGSN